LIDSKFKVIKPEECVIKQKYSFSYNPDTQPTIQRFYNITLKCFEDWSQQIYDVFTTLRYSTVQTYMEMSKAGRLHFHGYIVINDIANFYFYDLKKLKHYGTFEIDFITDPLIWDLYIKKQKDFMEIFCTNNEMVYHFNATVPTERKGYPFMGPSAPTSPTRNR